MLTCSMDDRWTVTPPPATKPSPDSRKTTMAHQSRRCVRWVHGAVVLCSLASVLAVVALEFAAAVASARTLYGFDSAAPGFTEYTAATIPRFIKMRIRDLPRQRREVHAATAARQRIVYLEPDEDDPTEYAVVYGNCSSLGGYQDGDRLYADWHMLPLLQRVLVGMNSSIDLSADPATHVAVVDCAYSGRVFQDTSMFKGYLVDVNVTTMMSFALQTMNGLRESTRMEAQVGPVVVSTAALDQFAVGPADAADHKMFGLRYHGASTYRTLVAFNFPYELNAPFHEAIHDGTLKSAQWRWRVKATNEHLVLNGYTGFYRGGRDERTNYYRYVLDMSGDPVRDVAADLYLSRCHTKDAWAWLQGLVIVVVGFFVVLQVVVALAIAVTTVVQTNEVWLPDLFPTIKRHLQLRTFLIALSLATMGSWPLDEWALAAVLRRYNLMSLVVVDVVVASHFLTFVLVWTDEIATALDMVVPPVVPAVAFLVCFVQREALVQYFTPSATDATVKDIALRMFLRNEVAYSTTTMNFWTRYRLADANDPPAWVVLHEFVWVAVPCGGLFLALCLTKAIAFVVAASRKAPVVAADYRVDDDDDDAVTDGRAPAPPLQVSSGDMAGVSTVPVDFLDNFLDAGGLPSRGVAVHRPATFRFAPDAFEVDKANLWLAGWVMLDRKFLVRVITLPNVAINMAFRASVVKVYCCRVYMDRGRLGMDPRLVTLPAWELSWGCFVRVALETVWVKKQVGDLSGRFKLSEASAIKAKARKVHGKMKKNLKRATVAASSGRYG